MPMLAIKLLVVKSNRIFLSKSLKLTISLVTKKYATHTTKLANRTKTIFRMDIKVQTPLMVLQLGKQRMNKPTSLIEKQVTLHTPQVRVKTLLTIHIGKSHVKNGKKAKKAKTTMVNTTFSTKTSVITNVRSKERTRNGIRQINAKINAQKNNKKCKKEDSRYL